MRKSKPQSVIVSLPFNGYGEWDAEIELAIERDIERLEGEEDADNDFLAALKKGDVDYDAIYDDAARKYVSYFDRLASEELKIELGLQFKGRRDFEILATMPAAAAHSLLRKAGYGRKKLDSLEWNALLCNELSDVDETMTDVFAYLAESTDVFFPLTV